MMTNSNNAHLDITLPDNAVMFDDSYLGMVPTAIDSNLLDLELTDIRATARQEMEYGLYQSIKQTVATTDFDESAKDSVH